MRVDLARSLRRIRPDRRTGSLSRRDDDQLDFAQAAALFGPPLLLDTSVYVDGLEGSLPPHVDALLQARTLMHLSVASGNCHTISDVSIPGIQARVRTCTNSPR